METKNVDEFEYKLCVYLDCWKRCMHVMYVFALALVS